MALFKKERVLSRPFGEEFVAIVDVVATRKECCTKAVRSPDADRDGRPAPYQQGLDNH